MAFGKARSPPSFSELAANVGATENGHRGILPRAVLDESGAKFESMLACAGAEFETRTPAFAQLPLAATSSIVLEQYIPAGTLGAIYAPQDEQEHAGTLLDLLAEQFDPSSIAALPVRELRQLRRRLARLTHPDRACEDQRTMANQRMSTINAAIDAAIDALSGDRNQA